jgi:hypothetical protein
MERSRHPMQDELESLVSQRRGTVTPLMTTLEVQRKLELKRLQKPVYQVEEEDRMFRDTALQMLNKEAINALLGNLCMPIFRHRRSAIRGPCNV